MRTLTIVCIGAALILLAIIILWTRTGPMSEDAPSGQACTLEAKLCPDGSAVGRTGPNCAFAPCPGESTSP